MSFVRAMVKRLQWVKRNESVCANGVDTWILSVVFGGVIYYYLFLCCIYIRTTVKGKRKGNEKIDTFVTTLPGPTKLSCTSRCFIIKRKFETDRLILKIVETWKENHLKQKTLSSIIPSSWPSLKFIRTCGRLLWK